jgi:hypothetical protein
MGPLSFNRLRFGLFDEYQYCLTLTRDSRITTMLSTLVNRRNTTCNTLLVGLEINVTRDGTKSVLQS